jgi:transposase-like protein
MAETTTRKGIEGEVQRAAVKITGQKFCNSCQQFRNVENGKPIMRGRMRQWKCFGCLEEARRRSGS